MALLGITSGEACFVRSVIEHVIESNGEIDDLLSDLEDARVVIDSIIQVGKAVEPVPEELEEIEVPSLPDEIFLDELEYGA